MSLIVWDIQNFHHSPLASDTKMVSTVAYKTEGTQAAGRLEDHTIKTTNITKASLLNIWRHLTLGKWFCQNVFSNMEKKRMALGKTVHYGQNELWPKIWNERCDLKFCGRSSVITYKLTIQIYWICTVFVSQNWFKGNMVQWVIIEYILSSVWKS